jgi:hypothetical protein
MAESGKKSVIVSTEQQQQDRLEDSTDDEVCSLIAGVAQGL